MDEGLPGAGGFSYYSLVARRTLLRFLLFDGSSFVGFCFSREIHGMREVWNMRIKYVNYGKFIAVSLFVRF